MPDVFEPSKRSEVMSKIRSKNTKAELIVFSYLNKQGLHYQKHYDKVVGKPDIALPRKMIAVFIDGEFWHGRTIEALKARRASKEDLWVVKIVKNIQRDQEQEKVLLGLGWRVLRIWDSDIKRKRTRAETLDTIAEFLKDQTHVPEIYKFVASTNNILGENTYEYTD